MSLPEVPTDAASPNPTQQNVPAATAGPFVLTGGDDIFTGGADKDVFQTDEMQLNFLDELDGGDGLEDTLELVGGGFFDIGWIAKFEHIESIVGSAAHDYISIRGDQLADVTAIDGGDPAGSDTLRISGDVIDLSGITRSRSTT